MKKATMSKQKRKKRTRRGRKKLLADDNGNGNFSEFIDEVQGFCRIFFVAREGQTNAMSVFV